MNFFPNVYYMYFYFWKLSIYLFACWSFKLFPIYFMSFLDNKEINFDLSYLLPLFVLCCLFLIVAFFNAEFYTFNIFEFIDTFLLNFCS